MNAPDRIEDRETGIAIRFISKWTPQTPEEVAAVWARYFSCASLGHTFVINRNEDKCNICGTPNTQLPFERNGYGVNEPAAWSRLYGGVCAGYFRDFGWRAAFLGGGE